jgi:hypothetical protein
MQQLAFDTPRHLGGTMANEMPNSEEYQGLSRKVLQYSENFLQIVNKIKQPAFSEERNTRDGVTDVSNTVTIYEFNQGGKLCKLDVYVSHITKR